MRSERMTQIPRSLLVKPEKVVPGRCGAHMNIHGCMCVLKGVVCLRAGMWGGGLGG